ncbi:beta-phosphoglucomutase [Rivularia sp. UHCC 0363]|uniref:beta-phosphoglucomutase n=1 Tax=Rivularia sp. UHCC 0363 TaxID=3110244 RepID=UPI002B1FDE00|nr:beta-phosphoglucomutase [Rivularia sp. UHCC 0363]MEA5592880.1 beta-phosphoglucomutase [Rivularia sp. UHCC 0363]
MLSVSVNNSQQTQQLNDSQAWKIIETSFNPQELHHKETVFTLGNGYLGVRGSFEEGYTHDHAGTIINGVYDDVAIAATEIVNCPNWLPLSIKIAGETFRMDSGEILEYKRQLDMRLGIVSRDVRWRSPSGHQIELHFERFVSLASQHFLAVRCEITSLDFAGEVEVTAGFEAEPHTLGIEHWQTLKAGGTDKIIWLHSKTLHSEIELGMAAKLVVENEADTFAREVECSSELTRKFQIEPGETVSLEKIVAVYTSRETSTPAEIALIDLVEAPSYSTLLATHIAAWERVWRTSDVIIEGDEKAQLSVRYNIFQILAATPRHNDKVSIPPKTLSGFEYRGHIFWDTEIFILPLLTFTQPALARNLLNYRYHTLPGARRKAQQLGYKGAMFAWESAITGDEVTPQWVHDPNGKLVRIWCGELEIHINADIAYASWNYWQHTGDNQWMSDYGAEIILDTAVFWESRVTWNEQRQSYDILNVIGPDENHEQVDNNAFTNVMVRWHLQTVGAVWEWLTANYPQKAAQLAVKLNIVPQRLENFAFIANNIYLNHDLKTGLIEQFDGFFNLEYVNLDHYEPRSKSMQGILGVEETQATQILKQPDVLMLFYLMRDQFDLKTIAKNWDYYTPRTDHVYGSSLGPAINAIIACDLNQTTEAYTHFMRAALVDLDNVRGNATQGIHSASAGGVWQAVVFGFAGIRITENGITTNPNLPSHWKRLKFRLKWQNQWYQVDLNANQADESIQSEGIPLSPITPISPSSQTASEVSTSIEGIIFDLDGVITDTSEFHYLAWKKLADEEGIPFDREANEGLRGIPRRESLMGILNGHPATESQIQEMMERKNNYYVELMQSITPNDLLPGATDLLAQLQAAGIKIALGSSSKNARTVIERLGIADKFTAIADGYSVAKSKPAPDLFLFAAEKLGVPPQNCIVVEDATAGIEAGLAADMKVVGLGPNERVGKAHVVLPSLDGVSWKDLQQQLANYDKQVGQIKINCQ